MSDNPKNLNIIFAVDATGSMSTTLEALKNGVFPQLFSLMPLFAPSAKFFLAIYRDFDQKGDALYKCHGPFSASESKTMIQIISQTRPDGGGDSDEAQKYAFGMLMREEAIVGKTIVFHFTDASPHSFPFPANANGEHGKEGQALHINGLEKDWIPLCKQLSERDMPVYTIGRIANLTQTYYCTLAQLTGGEVILLKDTNSDTILKASVAVMARALGYDECDLANLATIPRLSGEIPETENCPAFKNAQIKSQVFQEGQHPEINSASDVCNRKTLEDQYKTNPSFVMLCFEIFMLLISSGHILALTYNPLLGCLYRLMNRRSKVAQTEALREKLNKLMSETVTNLKATNKQAHEAVSKWLEESYNRVEEINELIMNAPSVLPFLTLQVTGLRMTKKDLTLACKIPMPQNLRRLTELITGVTLVEQRPKVMPEVFIPWSMSNDDLFALLSHLMCPGVKLDFRPSVVLAILTLNSGNAILCKRALEFLRTKSGTWFDKTGSEWHLFGFIKMILRLEAEYGGLLTKEEIAYLTPLFTISTLKYNNFELDCTRKFKLIPEHGKWYPDHKAKCPECHEFRSCSVMTEQGKCGLCCSYSPEELAKLDDSNAKKSALYDCTQCGSRYAVRNVDALNTKPKCYYCREGIKEIPKVPCTVCDINIVLPQGAEVTGQKAEGFMCAICVENGGEERFETSQARLHELLKQNSSLVPALTGLNISLDALLGRESLFAIKDKFTIPEKPTELPLVILLDGRPVLNTKEIIEKIREVIKTGSVNTEACLICYDEFIHIELQSPCCNKGCKALACKICIANWFSGNQPGHQVVESRFQCPMCKQLPVGGSAFNNRCFKEICSSLKTFKFDHDWHYAWCQGCGKLKEYMERQCAGNDPMDITNYTCEDCMNPGEHKKCPACGIMCVKASGCDHMECPKALGGCGIHWCYRCEGPDVFHSEDSQDVYDHLHDAHGNIWGAHDPNADENEDD